MSPEVSRRSVAKGAAWSVPAVVAGAPAAQAAASATANVGGFICKIHNGNGTINNEGSYTVNLGFSSTTGTVPSGTVLTYTFSVTKGTAYSFDPGTPVITGSTTKYSTAITASGTDPKVFTATLTFKDNTDVSQNSCGPLVTWQNTLRGGLQIAMTASASNPTAGLVSDAGGALTWRAAHRWAQSSSVPHTPTVFVSRSGAQDKYPLMDYDYFRQSDPTQYTTCGSGNSANDTSTIYPGGKCCMATAPFTSGGQAFYEC